MPRRRNTDIQRRINATAGSRRNVNGAGPGGRLVTYRDRNTGWAQAGRSQLGNRNQRYRDIRASMGLSTG